MIFLGVDLEIDPRPVVTISQNQYIAELSKINNAKYFPKWSDQEQLFGKLLDL